MKPIVIYYSLGGHCELAAQEVARQLECQTIQLQLEKPFPTGGSRYLFAGFSAMFNKKPALDRPLPDLSGYDTVFLGFPIWAGKPATPINTLLDQAKFSGKKIALFACSQGGHADQGIEALKQRLSGNEILGSIELVERDGHKEGYLQQTISDWLGDIILE